MFAPTRGLEASRGLEIYVFPEASRPRGGLRDGASRPHGRLRDGASRPCGGLSAGTGPRDPRPQGKIHSRIISLSYHDYI